MQKCLSAKSCTICIANQLSGFIIIGALFTERYSRTDQNVFSEIPFNKRSHYVETSQFIYISNQLTDFCKAQVEGISEHTPQFVHKYIKVKTVP